MQKTIKLNETETELRRVLLDASDYIGSLEGCSRPQLRFTGGWVRDKLLGVPSQDIDIGIDNMTGYNFGTRLHEYLEMPNAREKHSSVDLGGLATIKANPEKSKHLETVTTKLLGLDIDLVNLRKETYAADSRNPQMEFGTPEDDALRRDATVNALFYNLDQSEVEDFTGRGLEDMQRRVIKTPLAPYQTFKDDPLRVLRAIRFASRLDYEIAEEDEQAMGRNDIQEALKLKISRERVGVELGKMLEGPNPHRALSLIDRLNLYPTVLPVLDERVTQSPDTSDWHKAYGLARDLAATSPEESNDSTKVIKSILLTSQEDIWDMWLVSAFVPWARVPPPSKQSKGPASPAGLAAQNGIKFDGHTIKLIDAAASNLDDVIQTKDATIRGEPLTTSPLKRKKELVDRETQGLAIRRWGPKGFDWRSSVIYALLTQATEVSEEGKSLNLPTMI
ncbi:MAG: hypothetical protein Q9183_005865 [Haloplaca sp. 2 TL-2023]